MARAQRTKTGQAWSSLTRTIRKKAENLHFIVHSAQPALYQLPNRSVGTSPAIAKASLTLWSQAMTHPTTDSDYPLSEVPAGARKGLFSTTILLFGFTFFLSLIHI